MCFSTTSVRGAVVKYSVLIVSPAGYPHSECFREVAETIADALTRLGSQAQVTTRVRPGTRHIVLGAHLLLNQPMQIPDDSIIYNLEQIENNAFFATSPYFALLRRYALWDYSPDNVKELAKHDVRVQALLPIGYCPGLTRIETAADQDIDVLFIGSMNQRRKDILDGMEAAGLKTVSLFNKYGAEPVVPAAPASLRRNDPCFCGSGKKFKHCHGTV